MLHAGKLRQQQQEQTHQTWPKPFSRTLKTESMKFCIEGQVNSAALVEIPELSAVKQCKLEINYSHALHDRILSIQYINVGMSAIVGSNQHLLTQAQVLVARQ